MDKLDLIAQQLESYHLALDLRQNVVTAAQNFAVNVEKILDRRYQQGEALKRAGNQQEMSNAHARGPDKTKVAGLSEGKERVPVQPGADGARTDNA